MCDVREGSGRETEALLWFYMYTVGKEEKQGLVFSYLYVYGVTVVNLLF